MTKEALKHIYDCLTSSDIDYEFGEWNSDIVYPYFVGEYQEIEPLSECRMYQSTFILNGFSRGSWITLEEARSTIEELFEDYTTILTNGNGLSVYYVGSIIIPTDDAELKRIQINLECKEWKVTE